MLVYAGEEEKSFRGNFLRIVENEQQQILATLEEKKEKWFRRKFVPFH